MLQFQFFLIIFVLLSDLTKMFILPQIIKKRIEKQIGHPIAYPSDCERLAINIRYSLNETIGVTTLKRIFGFVDDVASPRASTLDILARYCGYDTYEEFKKILLKEGDSDFENVPDIVSANLAPGAVIKFTYLPDRKIVLIYEGKLKFRVTDCENGSLRNNDILTISYFNKNMPLIVTDVERDGKSLGRYVAGKTSGLISLDLES